MTWLDRLDRLGRLPAEVWLIPPVIFIGAMILIAAVRHRARLRRYRAIAARTGLSVTSGIVNPSQIHGTFSGRPLVMMTTSARRSGVRKTWTCVRIEVVNPSSIGLRLRRRDWIDRVLRLGDAPVGDAEFDRRFMVLSRQPGYVIMLFGDRAIRDALSAAEIEGVRLVGSLLEVFYRREARHPEQAVRLFEASVRVADAIDRIRYP